MMPEAQAVSKDLSVVNQAPARQIPVFLSVLPPPVVPFRKTLNKKQIAALDHQKTAFFSTESSDVPGFPHLTACLDVSDMKDWSHLRYCMCWQVDLLFQSPFDICE